MHPDFELFDRFKELALELRNTAAVVQNDHDRLIADGMISADDVRRNTAQFIERCEDHVSELQALQCATVRRLDAVLAALHKNPNPTGGGDYRQLCAELVEKLDELNCHYNVPNQSAIVERAHAELAKPEPERLTVQEISDLPQHGENYIAEHRDGEIQLDGYFSRADLQQLADSIPNTHD